MEKFVRKISIDAGTAILKKFGKVTVLYSKKDITDIVTEADLASNKIIVRAIRTKYPDHSIISEESDKYTGNSKFCWIIDPLDGTRNFATGVPIFAVMIGLSYDGEMILGAIYNPNTKEFLFAEKGKGAYLNGIKTHCSNQKSWSESYGIMNARCSRNSFFLPKISIYNKKSLLGVNAFGSAAVDAMYVASGRRDWKATRDTDHGIWDLAIPAIILKESGCVVTNFKGKPWSLKDKEIVYANKYLHPKFLKIINE
jgi:myo-inositol-1(or 4)-monophosphatase